MQRLDVSLDHGVLFLYDQEHSDVEIPNVSDDQSVYATRTALVLRTMVYVDGDVTLIVSSKDEVSDPRIASSLQQCGRWFVGTVEASSNRLSVMDADVELASIETSSHTPRVEVWTNAHTQADLVVIVVD